MLKSRASLHRSGFTLVELIVAMAILLIIVAAMGQIMGTASSLTTNNNKHTDANGRARTVFDRMATDFARMVKRNDVDFIFWKTPQNGNDAIYFFTEGASYYDGANPAVPDYKNSVSLVGYRVNNGNGNNGVNSSSYGQMERLGKALMWDGGTGANPAPMAFLNYPVPEAAATYSDSYLCTISSGTLVGAYSALGSSGGSLVGSAVGNYTDSIDSNYHPLASNVFRFEYSFQLKDGTQSVIPVMLAATATNANNVPSYVSAVQPPNASYDSDHGFVAGSRWYDSTDQIGYICVDASSGNAVWHEIGIQDISAIVVTIAVIDDQGMVFAKNGLPALAAQFADGTDASVAQTWTTALLPPAAGGNSPVSAATGIPQAMVSQIRIYQRFFYINNT